MATMYVYNIPTNETVNLRKTASSTGTILVRVGYGKAVQANYYNSTWHSASYNGYSGYIMSKFLTSTNPGGGGSSGGGTYLGQGTVIGGGSLYCRKEPQAGYAYWGQFQEGTAIPIYSCSTSGWYETRWPATGNDVGYVMTNYVSTSGGGSSGSLTVNQYIENLESYCNCGWTYGAGYNASTKIIDCAYYPYKARNNLGAHGCTTEYDSHLSSKGAITGGFDSLVRGMEVFQDDPDPLKKGHMGVYAGKVNIAGTVQHAVYQSCSSHNNIATKYNNGVAGDSGPNLTAMNTNWKYWGWSKYVIH